uniref:Uncharacterized protein n=1 Tax=Aegilops tauschii subsp. strangulata TaxID=200361 RepID=A0A452YIT7_AEGTS
IHSQVPEPNFLKVKIPKCWSLSQLPLHTSVSSRTSLPPAPPPPPPLSLCTSRSRAPKFRSETPPPPSKLPPIRKLPVCPMHRVL